MKFIGRLFIWFVAESLSYVFSQAIAEQVSANPFIYYPILILCFSLASLVATIGLFYPYIKELD
jgi:hypothetical protein